MADLSPAAQAVLDAMQDALDATAEITPRSGLVAAAGLRVVADQTTQPDPLMGIGCIIYSRDLYAIATELEAQ